MSIINEDPINSAPINGSGMAEDIVFSAIGGQIPVPVVLLGAGQFRIDDWVRPERRQGIVLPELRTDIVRRGW